MYSFYTDVGGRSNNEDSYLAIEKDGALLFAVADGLGGHECGEVASGITVDLLRSLFLQSPKHFNLEQAVFKANAAVLDKQRSTGKKMKTTISAAYVYGTKTVVANVGDSRLYLLKNNEIVFRTVDHSAAQMAVQAGEITEEDIRSYSDRNILTRALGSSDDVKIDIYKIDNDSYERMLVCSDGLWEHITEKEILETSANNIEPDNWILEMRKIHDSSAPRGCDNNTAVVFFRDQTGIVANSQSVKKNNRIAAFLGSKTGLVLFVTVSVLLVLFIILAASGLLKGRNSNIVKPTSESYITSDSNEPTQYVTFKEGNETPVNSDVVISTDFNSIVPTDETTPEIISDSPNIEATDYSTDIPLQTPNTTSTDLQTATPTHNPTATPTQQPTATPTQQPTATPTKQPTVTPTKQPTATPTQQPTATPTQQPTATPTQQPTATPTQQPTATPTQQPTATPTQPPTATPTQPPTATNLPTNTEQSPTSEATDKPIPTKQPDPSPSTTPESEATHRPTLSKQPLESPDPSPKDDVSPDSSFEYHLAELSGLDQK